MQLESFSFEKMVKQYQIISCQSLTKDHFDDRLRFITIYWYSIEKFLDANAIYRLQTTLCNHVSITCLVTNKENATSDGSHGKTVGPSLASSLGNLSSNHKSKPTSIRWRKCQTPKHQVDFIRNMYQTQSALSQVWHCMLNWWETLDDIL